MTPKEKAIELYNSFSHKVHTEDWEEDTKLYCIMCVDEILKSFDGFMDSRKHYRHELEIEAERYWIKVKEEIKNI